MEKAKRKSRSNKLMIDPESQKKTYGKRNPTLLKKARELATLCNVPVCMVSFSTDGKVSTWPENKAAVVDLITKYRNLSDDKKVGRCLNLSGFLETQRKKIETKKKKVEDQVGKVEERLIKEVLESFDGAPTESLTGLKGFLESKIGFLDEKLKTHLEKNGTTDGIREEEKGKSVEICEEKEKSKISSWFELCKEEEDDEVMIMLNPPLRPPTENITVISESDFSHNNKSNISWGNSLQANTGFGVVENFDLMANVNFVPHVLPTGYNFPRNMNPTENYIHQIPQQQFRSIGIPNNYYFLGSDEFLQSFGAAENFNFSSLLSHGPSVLQTRNSAGFEKFFL